MRIFVVRSGGQRLGASSKSSLPLECPRIVSTDVDDLRLLAEWHAVNHRELVVPVAEAVPAGVCS